MLAIYPNYYFIGATLTSIFLLYVYYLILRIPERSKASSHLAIAMVFTAVFNLSYVVTHGIYTVPTFFTRLINFYTPMVAALHVAVFFRLFPQEVTPKANKWILIGGHGLIIAITAWLGYVMTNSGVYYLFNSHFWDSDSLPAQKAVSVVILIFFLNLIATGIWRGLKEHGETRVAVFVIVGAYAFATIPPGIIQVLSRDNLLPRSAFMTATVICNLIGYFIAIVMYINVTRDRTSVLSRITGITLLAILFIFQAVAFFWLRDAEQNFDALMYGRAREGYVLGRMSEGGAYQYIYDQKKNKTITPVQATHASEQAINQQAEATHLLKEISALTERGEALIAKAESLIAESAIHSKLQARYLTGVLRSGMFSSGAEIVSAIVSLRNQQLYQISKIKQMSDAELEKKFPGLVASIDKKLPGFDAAANEYLAYEPIGAKRAKLTEALMPWSVEGTRLYRGNINYSGSFPSHFVAYQFADVSQNRVIEVGFSYLAYREAIARAAWPLVAVIFCASLFVIFGFNFFFKGALMKPINALIEGLKEVHNDNFDARVDIHVEDEIGFMAKSFNKMARSIKAGRMRLQKYAEQLEEKVKERTQELQTTLQDVQALKSQQDGDYFLTTLLLKPLGVNEVNSSFIGIESYIRQKKKFEFRHWSKDIGGDINISHIIELEGKRHIAFINADAMGKSIQGAGGALVLGSVFHTIIERTQATAAMQQLSPERWLKNVFIELHRVFESFDGSMLVSGFFGLIDEHTGLMYYILAEHPFAVLYRNGKADFISSDRMLRKLGTTGVEGKLQINTTQLEPGDILITGSDGRDDLILGYDEHGGRIINEDENLFLRIVEEAAGNVSQIVEGLEARGEIMDDLSLMRIERYREEHAPNYAFDYSGVFDGVKRDLKAGKTDAAIARIEAYLKQDAFYPEAVKNLAQIYYQSKEFEKAARYAQDYLWLKPADTQFVYFASLCFRRIRDYRKSIDLSERLRLRELPLAKNLALLTDLHIRMNNTKRAEAMLAELVALDPDFASIDLLKKKLSVATNNLVS